jgi:hypothetical protein
MHFATQPTDCLYIDNENTNNCRYYIRGNPYPFAKPLRARGSELSKVKPDGTWFGSNYLKLRLLLSISYIKKVAILRFFVHARTVEDL